MTTATVHTRPATSFLATLSLLMGLAAWGAIWWNSYTPIEGIKLTGGSEFFLFLVGLAFVIFGHGRIERAGATNMQLLTVLAAGAVGLGVWVLAMLAPTALFDHAIPSQLGFGAFLMGCVALSAAAKAARAMAGESVVD